MIQRKDEGAPAKSGLLYKLKQALPWQFIRQITRYMPRRVLDHFVSLWSSGMFDWSQTRYFPLPMDHAGYIRINLRDRESQGIVECGDVYHQLCAHLEDALLSFRDVATGKPIVDKVYRLENLAPPDATFRNHLPDLVVTWSDVSAIESKGIYSENYGALQLDGRLPSGRAGNHTKDGWFIACGHGIPPGSSAQDHKIVDLAPTLFQWLNAPLPDSFQGRAIPELCIELQSSKQQ
jgi:predicted AlkP superfamily phosphohydrolase/phosphomutase